MSEDNRELKKRGSTDECGGDAGPEERTGSAAAADPIADRADADDEAEARSEAAPRVGGTGTGSGAGQDAAAHGDRPPPLEEMLGLLRAIEQRTAGQKGGGTGPDEAAFDRLAKSVKELGGKGEVPKALRKGMARRDRKFGSAVETAAKLARELRNYRSDLARWVEQDRRSRRRWTALAIAAGFPACLLLGVLAQQRFEVVPLNDPTGGWRQHVWERYGQRIVGCAAQAMNAGAEVNCRLVVRER